MQVQDQKDSALLPGVGTRPATFDVWDSHPGLSCDSAELALLRVLQVSWVPSPRLGQEDPLS